MYAFTSEGRLLGLRRQVFPVLIVGCGPDAFIGPCAWICNLLATWLFKIVLVAPSRDVDKCKQFANDYDMPEGSVSHDYAALLKRGVELHGDDLVVCICTETAQHCDHMLMAIDAGVKTILIDKPPVLNYGEWKKVNDAATAKGVLICVSFQHSMNASVHQIAELTAKGIADGKDVAIQTGFLQDWLINPPDIRQARWRLSNKYCGVYDLKSHVGHLGSVIAGSPIAKVLRSEHSMVRETWKDLPGLDNGIVEVEYANGIRGTVRYHQALRGHKDDIYGIAEIDSESYQFALEWGGGDTMYRKGGRGHRGGVQNWYAETRGGNMFSGAVNTAWSKNPPGHMQAWDTMWFSFFFAANRLILERRGDERAKYMIPLAQNRVPTFEVEGRESALFVDAVIKSFETEQEVDVESMAA